MNNKDNFKIGNEIRNIIQNAVNTRDFTGLSHDIRNMVNRALDETGLPLGRNREKDDSPFNTYEQNQQPKYQQTKDHQPQNHQNKNQYTRYNYAKPPYAKTDKHEIKQQKPYPKPVKYTVPVGQVSGTVQIVFGIIGSIIFGIIALMLAMTGYAFQSTFFNSLFLFGSLPFFLGSLTVAFNGSNVNQRLKRFRKYVAIMDGKNYSMIRDFSSATGKNEKFTAKDIQKMIDKGMFPEGHIDDKKTCFMLNNESYQQYLLLKENMKIKEIEEQARLKKERANQKQPLDPEIRKAIDEGRQYVQKIRDANIALEGEEISRKLDKLEEVTGKIFDYVEAHPKKFPEIKKFTEYFLPTTLKLLDAYRQLDSQTVTGKNITTAKGEIEQSLDTINIAFDNLLDGLFEEIALDVSTDISVLETIFAQEGLMNKNKNLNNGGIKL